MFPGIGGWTRTRGRTSRRTPGIPAQASLVGCRICHMQQATLPAPDRGGDMSKSVAPDHDGLVGGPAPVGVSVVAQRGRCGVDAAACFPERFGIREASPGRRLPVPYGCTIVCFGGYILPESWAAGRYLQGADPTAFWRRTVCRPSKTGRCCPAMGICERHDMRRPSDCVILPLLIRSGCRQGTCRPVAPLDGHTVGVPYSVPGI